MDWMLIQTLLNVVHMTIDMPNLRVINMAAMKELQEIATPTQPLSSAPKAIPSEPPIFPPESGTNVTGDGSISSGRRL